jgi:hypothetical protein
MLNGRVLDRVSCWDEFIHSHNICGYFRSPLGIEGASTERIVDRGKDGPTHFGPYDGL